MQVQRHIQRCTAAVEVIQRRRIETGTELGTNARTPKAKFTDCAAQFFSRGRWRLHRQCGEAGEPARVTAYQCRQHVVVATTESDRRRNIDEMKIRQGVGRQHLAVDAGTVHGREAHFGIHEGTAPVTHAMQPITTGAKQRATILRNGQFGTVFTRGSEGFF